MRRAAVDGRVILYFHGGGYIAHTMSTSRKLIGHLAKATRASALVPDYRLAPDHAFPAQVEDAIAAYRWLLDNDVTTTSIAFAGGSASGNLALAAAVKAQLEHLPLPATIVGFSPWLDLLGESGSFDTNPDAFLSRTVSSLMAGMFLGETGSSSDPLANPLHPDPTGFPPIFLTAGGDESLTDTVRFFADTAKAHGVPVELQIASEMQHAFQWMAGRAPEADDSIVPAGAWLQNHLDATD
jgi:acetyl esterase/lipase